MLWLIVMPYFAWSWVDTNDNLSTNEIYIYWEMMPNIYKYFTYLHSFITITLLDIELCHLDVWPTALALTGLSLLWVSGDPLNISPRNRHPLVPTYTAGPKPLVNTVCIPCQRVNNWCSTEPRLIHHIMSRYNKSSCHDPSINVVLLLVHYLLRCSYFKTTAGQRLVFARDIH